MCSDVASSYTDRDTLRQVVVALDLLAIEGPTLGRPIVDRIKGVGLHHLKELRSGSAGTSGGACRVSIRTVDQGGGVVTEWHTWDEVSAELRRLVDVAERIGVSKARVSYIEHGVVARIELLARYLDAIGGRLEITAAFDGGTERVVLDWLAA